MSEIGIHSHVIQLGNINPNITKNAMTIIIIIQTSPLVFCFDSLMFFSRPLFHAFTTT